MAETSCYDCERHAAASISAHLYSHKTVPFLGYTPQLALPPNKLSKQEKGARAPVLHMANNAIDTISYFNGPQSEVQKLSAQR